MLDSVPDATLPVHLDQVGPNFVCRARLLEKNLSSNLPMDTLLQHVDSSCYSYKTVSYLFLTYIICEFQSCSMTTEFSGLWFEVRVYIFIFYHIFGTVFPPFARFDSDLYSRATYICFFSSSFFGCCDLYSRATYSPENSPVIL